MTSVDDLESQELEREAVAEAQPREEWLGGERKHGYLVTEKETKGSLDGQILELKVGPSFDAVCLVEHTVL